MPTDRGTTPVVRNHCLTNTSPSLSVRYPVLQPTIVHPLTGVIGLVDWKLNEVHGKPRLSNTFV
jgi:hypothetical protein